MLWSVCVCFLRDNDTRLDDWLAAVRLRKMKYELIFKDDRRSSDLKDCRRAFVVSYILFKYQIISLLIDLELELNLWLLHFLFKRKAIQIFFFYIIRLHRLRCNSHSGSQANDRPSTTTNKPLDAEKYFQN